MKAQWYWLAGRIDALSLRERVLLTVTVIVIVLGLWSWLVLAPYDARREQASERSQAVQRNIAALQTQVDAVITRANADPDAELRERFRRLQQRLEEVDAEIHARGRDFVAPAQMPGLLRDILAAHGGLTLQRLESTGARRMGPPGAEAPVFKHGLVLEFSGDYMSTLRYLEALEQLPWRFLWEQLEYTLEQHPRARVRLRLATMSGHEDWIGV
jgi:MSHA biogenesis protein MshJ